MTMKQISRRDFLRMAATTTAGGVLAACKPKAVETQKAPEIAEKTEAQPTVVAKPAPVEGQTVQYWVQWGGSYAGDAWTDLKATSEFKEIFGNNNLEIKGSVPEDALLTAIAGGTPPDGAGNYNYLDYMARGVLRPVDDYVAASTRIKKEDFIEANWELGFFKGKFYGIPTNEAFMRFGTDYNARMVEAVGLDPTKPPETWSEWLEWHKKLTKFDAAGNLKQIGLDPTDAMGEGLWTTDGWLVPMSWGFQWFDEAKGTFNLNNEQMVDSFETYKKFIDIIGIDNLTGMRQVEGQGTWGGSYNAEVQAVIIEGYWHPGETAVEKPEVLPFNRATWAPVPDNRKGVKTQTAGGHMIMIFKDSKNPELMYSVTEFLSTNAACDIIFKKVGWLPAVIKYLDTVDTSTYPGLDFYFRSVKEATEWHKPAQCPITSFVSTTWGDIRERFFRKEITSKDAAVEFQTRVEVEWKNAGFGT